MPSRLATLADRLSSVFAAAVFVAAGLVMVTPL